MKLLDIMNGISCTLIEGNTEIEIDKITIDSREVTKNTLFFCIKGIHVDGHSFIKQVKENGGAAIIIEEEQESYPDITVLKVESVRTCLSFAAANFYKKPANRLNLFGVTGTNGKTSVTYFLESIFKEAGEKTGVIGTVGNKIENKTIDVKIATGTTPDSIELQEVFCKMREESAKNIIMEVSSHALALDKVEGLDFLISVFTNLTQDHLDFHKTMEEYKKAKAKLFSRSKVSILNSDDEAYEDMMKTAKDRVLTYSIDNDSDFKAEDVKFLKNGVEYKLTLEGETHTIFVPVRGKFTVYNSLASLAVAYIYAVDIEIIKKALSNTKGVPGRIQSVENDKGIDVIIDYAHTPDGLLNILSSVREFTTGKIITVFGCGGDRDKAKRPIMAKIAGNNSDYCIITSDNPRSEEPENIINETEKGIENCPYEKIIDRKEAIFKAINLAKPEDTVVIAGKGHENYQILKTETIGFDDSKIAKEALDSLNLSSFLKIKEAKEF